MDAWWLQLCALALVAWRVQGATPKRAGLIGMAFGVAWLGSGLWWLYISMHRFGGLPAGVAGAVFFIVSVSL